MKFLTAHWDLKLVALVLAVALWIYTSGQVRTERTVDVLMSTELIGGLGENYQITSMTPSQFRVTLSVPANRWALLPANDQLSPRLEVRSEVLQNRQQEFPVTSSMLGIPSDIRIVRTEPENLRAVAVHWDYIIEDALPAEPPPLANVPPGLEAEAHLDRDQVKVRAAADVIAHERQDLNRVRFQPIDLSAVNVKISGTQSIHVELSPVANLPYKVMHTETATIELRPVPQSLSLPAMPVAVLLPARYVGKLTVTLFPARVNLLVHGPENLIKALKPDSEIQAYVDLRQGLEIAGSQDVTVQLLCPSWLGAEPLTVHVTTGALTSAVEDKGAEPPLDHSAPAPAPTPGGAPTPETVPGGR